MPRRNALPLHYPHPEHRVVADVHVVLVHEVELAVVTDAEHRQARRHVAHRRTIPHEQRSDMRRDQQAPARVVVATSDINVRRLLMILPPL